MDRLCACCATPPGAGHVLLPSDDEEEPPHEGVPPARGDDQAPAVGASPADTVRYTSLSIFVPPGPLVG